MKKVFKYVLLFIIILLLISIIYFYNNKDKSKELASIIDIYIKSMIIPEHDYTEKLKINGIKTNINNYYYEKLNSNQKSIYKSLANGIKELNNEIILRSYKYKDANTTSSDVELAFTYFSLDHPEVFYLKNDYSISSMKSIIGNKVVVEVSYLVESMNELNTKIDKINNVINQYLAKVENKTYLEAEIILHDELAKNVNYSEHVNVENVPKRYHTIEGAFLADTAVCDGLAKSIQVLLSNLGIENIVVLGKLDNVAHAWNMIKLEDKWYNLDITSNKSIHLTTTKNAIVHSYFNISNEVISQTHVFDNKDIIPKSENLEDKYNYYIHTNKYISKEDEFDIKLEQIINENNENILEFYSEDEDVKSKAYNIIKFNKKNEYLLNNKINYFNIYNTHIITKNYFLKKN